MHRFALSTAAILTLAISSVSATELPAPRDVAPVIASSAGGTRLAMHDDMHKHMDSMKGNMQGNKQPPQQPAPAHPGGNPQPADPNANTSKPADPANPGAAHNPPSNPVNPPAHTAQPPMNKGMKHM